jgi:hypothetical protein
MVDSITQEDLNRMSGYLNMQDINSRADYEREFEQKFGVKANYRLKEYLWEERIWELIVEKYKGQRRSWQDVETDFLKANVGQRASWLAKHFPTARSYSSIYHKRRRLAASVEE